MLTIRPLENYIDWTEFVKPLQGGGFTVVRAVEIVLDGYDLGEGVYGERVSFSGGSLIVMRGFRWDGASGPVFDNPVVVVASLIHDILCAASLLTYVTRHVVYWKVMRRQGEIPKGKYPGWRVALRTVVDRTRMFCHLSGLLFFNGIWGLGRR